jgi:hypothetical protein
MPKNYQGYQKQGKSQKIPQARVGKGDMTTKYKQTFFFFLKRL